MTYKDIFMELKVYSTSIFEMHITKHILQTHPNHLYQNRYANLKMSDPACSLA